jgi:hypothetical protein
MLEAILKVLDADSARRVADKLLDEIEDRVIASDNKYDDLLIPIIKKAIREPFGIPDNDEPPVDTTTSLQ